MEICRWNGCCSRSLRGQQEELDSGNVHRLDGVNYEKKEAEQPDYLRVRKQPTQHTNVDLVNRIGRGGEDSFAVVEGEAFRYGPATRKRA